MTRQRLLRELRTIGRAWCLLSAVGALAGGVYGWVTRESDDA